MNSKGLIFALIGTIAGWAVSSGIEKGLNDKFNPEKAEREEEMREAFNDLIGKDDEED